MEITSLPFALRTTSIELRSLSRLGNLESSCDIRVWVVAEQVIGCGMVDTRARNQKQSIAVRV
jgi:hypothetical protein